MNKRRQRRNARIAAVILLLILLLGILGKVRGDEGTRAELTANTTSLTVGDPVTLTLTVIHPAGTRVIIPDLGKAWGDFEVRSQSAAKINDNKDGTESTSQQIEVTLFEIGDFETPKLKVQVVDENGASQDITAAPISLTVATVLQEGDADLRDIKPQAELPLPSKLPYIVGGVAGALAVLALAAYFYRRYRRRSPHLKPAVDLRPAYQIALDELAQVEQMGLIREGQFKAHYTHVSDILRRYLDRAFTIPAIDQTTNEIRRSLKQSAMTGDHAHTVLDLLSSADLVKFAKYMPEMDEAGGLILEARHFVETTAPREAVV